MGMSAVNTHVAIALTNASEIGVGLNMNISCAFFVVGNIPIRECRIHHVGRILVGNSILCNLKLLLTSELFLPSGTCDIRSVPAMGLKLSRILFVYHHHLVLIAPFLLLTKVLQEHHMTLVDCLSIVRAAVRSLLVIAAHVLGG